MSDFYDRHPISEEQVLAAVARRRGSAAPPLVANDLFDFDQDHYGGLAAVATLARRAKIGAGTRVLDVCAGLAGPARFLATEFHCQVVAVELHHGRAVGARRLTQRVGLADRIRVVRGDAARLPLGAASMDACLSQEAFLHVPDKGAVLAECRRVLVPAGRLAFTDWIAHPRLDDGDRRRLDHWLAATTLQTIDGYRRLLVAVGFRAIEAEDLTDQWRPILRARFELHRALRPRTVARFGEVWDAEYRQVYEFFVSLVERGRLGGGRFTATR